MPNVTQSPDDLELMMTCLKQGGVSLIGKKTAMTRDEYRKSFIKRNKNPDINHKAHALRVLQSTLKAKLQELEALNQILDNPNLDSAIFQKWKSEHDQLYVNVGKGSQATAKNVYSMDVEGSNDQKKQDSDESEANYRWLLSKEELQSAHMICFKNIFAILKLPSNHFAYYFIYTVVLYLPNMLQKSSPH
ncbi:hypothetical protein AB205_0066230, partial [Aquarana catesbeiana]